MLVGTVYLFLTMPTGFIPSQDSGFLFGDHAWGRRTSRSNPWPATIAPSPKSSARDPNVQDVGAFVIGGNQAFFFADTEAARPAARSPSTRPSRSCGPR